MSNMFIILKDFTFKMNFYILLILYTFFYKVHTESNAAQNYNRMQLHNELNRQLRNHYCCVRNMKCCHKTAPPLEVKIRAILLKCPSPRCPTDTVSTKLDESKYSIGTSDRKQFAGIDEDEPLPPSSITNCHRKLMLTMKTSKLDAHRFQSQYVVVDHVYDPESKKQQRLLTPYVVKFNQEPVMQMYGMKFLHVINSHAREEVINKHFSNYTGCDTTSNKPTCGKLVYKGKVIPFSEGFCCSCDPVKNSNRQPESLNTYPDTFISYGNPDFLLNGIECPQSLQGELNAKSLKNNALFESLLPQMIADQQLSILSFPIPNNKVSTKKCHKHVGFAKHHLKKQRLSKAFSKSVNNSEIIKAFPKPRNMSGNPSHKFGDVSKNNFTNRAVEEVNTDANMQCSSKRKNRSKTRRFKRQVQASGTQRRGGQNCADRYTPAGLDPETYHESAHCLRFSDLWYTAYRLQEPGIEHSIVFEVFEKHENLDGQTFWKDITQSNKIKVGTIVNQYINEKKTVSVRYKSRAVEEDARNFAFDYRTTLFLVPEGVPSDKLRYHPEIRKGPPEFLVIHSSQISLDGDQCNLGGVGFEAFVKQPNRCARPKGTCLLNQPYHLWKHDYLAEQLGKKGCFFLKHYGKLPKDPIRKYTKSNQKFLLMEYPGRYSSTVEFEIKADFNAILKHKAPAVITEVYVDSTRPFKTILTVKITNSGLVSCSFIAKLSDCPLEMPASFNNIETEPVLIPPQHQHIFHLNIKAILPVDRFHCSVEALNVHRQLAAIRRVRIQKFDRCICTWHCLCACVGSLEGLQCVPMSLQQYHAAGFHGSLPISTHVVHYTFIDDVMSFMFYMGLFSTLTLFMLGFCKALIGICCSPVIGTLGLDVILDLPKPLGKYYEFELSDRPVIYNSDGWPIHPDTKERVRCIARSTEFCMNIIFFFAYPVDIFILIAKRFDCLPHTHLTRNSQVSINEIEEMQNESSPASDASSRRQCRSRFKKRRKSSSAYTGSITVTTTIQSEDYDGHKEYSSVSKSKRIGKSSVGSTDSNETTEASPNMTTEYTEESSFSNE